MDARARTETTASGEDLVCSWRHVRWIDNVLRPWVHDVNKLFGAYVREGMRVLDAGCGRGFASLGLARLVGDGGLVIAADVQPQMLSMVRARAERAGLAGRIRTHRCRRESLDVGESVDFAVAFWMVHETPDPRDFLREVRDLMNPGGRMFLAEPRFHVSGSAFDQILHHAEAVGWSLVDRPRVFFSRAAVLEGRRPAQGRKSRRPPSKSR
jgi:2-polyprenyl-3-methyl-5-hydroxy-6-metoxy-1,4-benzoquinol methylase